jgi:MFS family permease
VGGENSESAASVFLIGTGFALNAPAFSAVVPEIVSDEQLPSASTLTGLQLNISTIEGPALGGLLLAVAGAKAVFALNALCLLAAPISIGPWKPNPQINNALTQSRVILGFFESPRKGRQ